MAFDWYNPCDFPPIIHNRYVSFQNYLISKTTTSTKKICCNLGKNTLEKFTTLSKIVFPTKRFPPDFSQTVLICLLGWSAGHSHSVPSISGGLLKIS